MKRFDTSVITASVHEPCVHYDGLLADVMIGESGFCRRHGAVRLTKILLELPHADCYYPPNTARYYEELVP